MSIENFKKINDMQIASYRKSASKSLRDLADGLRRAAESIERRADEIDAAPVETPGQVKQVASYVDWALNELNTSYGSATSARCHEAELRHCAGVLDGIKNGDAS